MKPEADDFQGDAFMRCWITDLRAGDIVRTRRELWQVLHTLGFVFSARRVSDGAQRTFSMATMGELEKRVGQPLPVEW